MHEVERKGAIPEREEGSPPRKKRKKKKKDLFKGIGARRKEITSCFKRRTRRAPAEGTHQRGKKREASYFKEGA